MSTTEQIAARLKELRTRRGLSQGRLAALCGWSQSRIGNYESGTRSIGHDDAIIMAKNLGVTPGELVFGDQGDPEKWLNEKQKKILELFDQLPETEQDSMISVAQLRLKELDEYVEKYLKGRFRKADE